MAGVVTSVCAVRLATLNAVDDDSVACLVASC